MNKSLYDRELDLLAQAKNFFTDTWDKITNFFTSYHWQEILFNIKTIFIIISFLLLLAIVFLLIKIIIFSPLERSLFKSSKTHPVFSKKKIKKRLSKINKRLKSNLEPNYKLAVLEVDKLFDEILKEIGYGKEKKLSNLDEIREANKVKNNIVENKRFKLSKEEAEKTVKVYEKGINGLLVL